MNVLYHSVKQICVILAFLIIFGKVESADISLFDCLHTS